MKRALVALTVAALPLSVALPAQAAPPSARGIDAACTASDTSNLPFTDVAMYEDAIHCIWQWGVTTGTSRTTYTPMGTVTRAQMATFVARMIRNAGADLPQGPDAFIDDESYAFEDDINALAEAGIVNGTSGRFYSPWLPVTRAQMAAFLVRSYHYASGQDIGASADYFPDDAGHGLEGDINIAAEAGFTGGYADGTYGPLGTVRRDHMALFMARWLDLAVEDGLTEPPEVAPTPPSPAPGPSEGFGDGTHLVGGTGIAPGLYQTTGTDLCYWARLSGTSGESDDILANDLVSSGPAIVEISATDVAFESSGCGTWRPASLTGTPSTSFGDGTWLVGVQVQPGTYQATATDFCYWGRLSGASGELDDIIANDIQESGPAVVTIAETDFAIDSSGCGTWTRTSS